MVYGFDVLKAISDEGNTDGMPKQPVVVTGGVGELVVVGVLLVVRARGEAAWFAASTGRRASWCVQAPTR